MQTIGVSCRLEVLVVGLYVILYKFLNLKVLSSNHNSISGLVVKSIVAIDGPRVRFAADANQIDPNRIASLFAFCLADNSLVEYN